MKHFKNDDPTTSEVHDGAVSECEDCNEGGETFDAGDDEAADKARQAGQLLGELGGDRTTLRISTDTTLPIVLLRWSLQGGWATEEPRA